MQLAGMDADEKYADFPTFPGRWSLSSCSVSVRSVLNPDFLDENPPAPDLEKKRCQKMSKEMLIIKRASFTGEKRWKDVIRCATISVIIKTFSFTREKSVELYISPSLFWSLFAFSFKVFEEYSIGDSLGIWDFNKSWQSFAPSTNSKGNVFNKCEYWILRYLPYFRVYLVSVETILFWLWPYVLWPLITVHKCAETIQGRKLYAEIRYVNFGYCILKKNIEYTPWKSD